MRSTRLDLKRVVRVALAEAAADSEPIVFTNDLDPSMNVIIVYPEDPRYDQVAPVFDQKGHAFLAREDIMVVDGAALSEPWFTEDHLTVIQAHEFGHKLAGHQKNERAAHNDPQLEREADWLGFNILRHRGMHSAADLHEEEYRSRYGSLPGQDDYLMTDLADLVG